MNKAGLTRLNILQKAFELIYAKGYQATSVDDIIATTKVTKGAFYYHFKTKDEMGLAIIQDILNPSSVDLFIEPFQQTNDPNKEIYGMIKHLLYENPVLLAQYGCPVSNLAQEMTPWHQEFSDALNALTARWRQIMIDTIKNGKKSGYYKSGIHPGQVADFVLSGYWGIRNLGKVNNSADCYKGYLKELKNYLQGLR
jgi:TetR/AcrR family transcriptional repressor of nem operon